MAEVVQNFPVAESIDPIVNQQATRLILRSIAWYPQDNTGPSFLIANHIMRSLGGDLVKYSLTIRQLASIDPDAKRAALVINKIHKAFGVPRVVTQREALAFVLSFAANSLDRIRLMAVEVSNDHGYVMDEYIRYGTVETFGGNQERLVPKDVINKKVAFQLEDYLESNPEVKRGVAKEIAEEARKYREKSWEQQARHAKITRRANGEGHK